MSKQQRDWLLRGLLGYSACRLPTATRPLRHHQASESRQYHHEGAAQHMTTQLPKASTLTSHPSDPDSLAKS